jgi:hypothetical protein
VRERARADRWAPPEERSVTISGPNPNLKSENEFQIVPNWICSKGYLPQL